MIIGVAAIIVDKKKILMIKRAKTKELHPGHWGLPGGKVEEGETPEEAVVREAKEETNLDFVPKRLFIKHTFPDRIGYRYIGDWAGKIKIQESEIEDYGWYTYDEAIKLEFAFNHRDTIEKLHEEGLI